MLVKAIFLPFSACLNGFIQLTLWTIVEIRVLHLIKVKHNLSLSLSLSQNLWFSFDYLSNKRENQSWVGVGVWVDLNSNNRLRVLLFKFEISLWSAASNLKAKHCFQPVSWCVITWGKLSRQSPLMIYTGSRF